MRRHTLICLSAALFVAVLFVGAAPSLARSPTVMGSTRSPELLQFSSGGHVLGFEPGAMLAVAGSHALRVAFVDANAVTPQSASASDKAAVPLTSVSYPDLWDGVTLTYDASGIVRSTYRLEPYADVSAIRVFRSATQAPIIGAQLTLSDRALPENDPARTVATATTAARSRPRTITLSCLPERPGSHRERSGVRRAASPACRSSLRAAPSARWRSRSVSTGARSARLRVRCLLFCSGRLVLQKRPAPPATRRPGDPRPGAPGRRRGTAPGSAARRAAPS